MAGGVEQTPVTKSASYYSFVSFVTACGVWFGGGGWG